MNPDGCPALGRLVLACHEAGLLRRSNPDTPKMFDLLAGGARADVSDSPFSLGDLSVAVHFKSETGLRMQAAKQAVEGFANG
ncbi:MAG: hypothetical protein KIT83_19690 [Bryobacterales bacterium]|nr:hypothetical protein [Bryobacterales bacterium]